GSVAVHPWKDHGMAEVACVYIRKSHEGLGYGRKLVRFAEMRAADLGAHTLFALSTQAYNFFGNKLGFSAADPSALPPARLEKLLRSGRNSRIMLKRIGPSDTGPGAQSQSG